MSVACRITLPAAAHVHDVATVIGIAAGLPKRQQPLGSPAHPNAWYAKTDGISVKSNGTLPECANIEWSAADGPRYVLYHHEFEGGTKGLLPRSTPFWICVARRLVDVFGGTVTYQDCDDKIDYAADPPDCLSAGDGEPWQRWQERMFSVEPITEAELHTARPAAAYQP